MVVPPLLPLGNTDLREAPTRHRQLSSVLKYVPPFDHHPSFLTFAGFLLIKYGLRLPRSLTPFALS